jgi:hypothetical protein
VAGFGHEALGSLTWNLPTAPNTLRIGLSGSVYAEPLGTLAPDPLAGGEPNEARWRAALHLAQDVHLRRGRLRFEVDGSYLRVEPDGRDLNRLVIVHPPTLDLAGWEGFRVSGGAGYHF